MIGPGYKPCEDKNKTYADSPLYTDEDYDKIIKLNNNVSKFA